MKDANGKVTTCAFEELSPNALARQGWNRNSLKKGEEVTVDGYLAKDGELLLKVRYVGLCGTDLTSFRGKNPLLCERPASISVSAVSRSFRSFIVSQGAEIFSFARQQCAVQILVSADSIASRRFVVAR